MFDTTSHLTGTVFLGSTVQSCLHLQMLTIAVSCCEVVVPHDAMHVQPNVVYMIGLSCGEKLSVIVAPYGVRSIYGAPYNTTLSKAKAPYGATMLSVFASVLLRSKL